MTAEYRVLHAWPVTNSFDTKGVRESADQQVICQASVRIFLDRVFNRLNRYAVRFFSNARDLTDESA